MSEERRLPRSFIVTLCMLSPAAFNGCAELERELTHEVRLVVEGPTAIQVGQQAQLRAETLHADDEDYDWKTSDSAVASVDSDGLVTAISLGEATITAEGEDSKERGEHPVVVVAFAPDAAVPEPDAGPQGTDGIEGLPHYRQWLSSAHADQTSEAFTHWDEDGEVETDCARCHSADGFLDYLGADGSAVQQVDKPGSPGAIIDCETCHDPAAESLASVVFPSGVEVDGLAAEARCMTCHQGRASAATVDEAIAEADADDDEPSDDLRFINIHYYPAGATLYAASVSGGYQYAGETYDWRFRHAPQAETCIGCHDPHSLQVRIDQCAECHQGVEDNDDLRDIRMIASSAQDYDGDGDLGEGIYHELAGLQSKALRVIQTYPEAVGTTAICYDESAYPYFFADSNDDGECDEDEAQFGNAYAEWTPRLLRAAYNYQMVTKDPGAFAHNAKYVIQLLHDSIASLQEVADANIDLTELVRNDSGHFNGAGEAARHWDEDEEVSSRCSKCHGGVQGLRAFLELGVSIDVEEPDNGLSCATCHDRFGLTSQEGAYSVAMVDSVTYPSGVVITGEPTPSNLCRTCHTGRESGATLRAAIDAGELSFRNVHYLPAASVRLGTEVKAGYEFDGKSYVGKWKHNDNNECTSCHDPVLTQHTFRAADAYEGRCATCHGDAGSTDRIRSQHLLDYDDDGDSGEPLSQELETLQDALLEALQVRASAGEDGQELCYDEHAYPYFFIDTNGSGVCDPDEANRANQYSAWTPELLTGAFNYQLSKKEPGAWAHNFEYMAQLLIDSIEAAGGSVGRYTRPAVP